jgi:hypothetical protein
MGFSAARATILTMVVLAMGLVAGCGGSSSSTTDGSTSSSGGSTKPVAGFSKKAKPAAFGEEATEEERAQASETLERNMSARAAGNYAVQCETLSAPAVKKIEGNGSGAIGEKKTCAETLESEAKKAPPGLLENTLVAPIDALRIKGNRGYAIYHGREGDYAMAMELESGEWKVAATLTEALPKN